MSKRPRSSFLATTMVVARQASWAHPPSAMAKAAAPATARRERCAIRPCGRERFLATERFGGTVTVLGGEPPPRRRNGLITLRLCTRQAGNSKGDYSFDSHAGAGVASRMHRIIRDSKKRSERRLLPDKGKPIARWGRKVTGQPTKLTAGLPKEGLGHSGH
jgi:hypothetical protein